MYHSHGHASLYTSASASISGSGLQHRLGVWPQDLRSHRRSRSH